MSAWTMQGWIPDAMLHTQGLPKLSNVSHFRPLGGRCCICKVSGLHMQGVLGGGGRVAGMLQSVGPRSEVMLPRLAFSFCARHIAGDQGL